MSIVTEEHFMVETLTMRQVKEEKEEEEGKEDNKEDEQMLESEGWAVFRADGVEFQLDLKARVEQERQKKEAEDDVETKSDDDDPERYYIGE